MIEQRCLFCGGDPTEANHWARCDGRQGGLKEEFDTDTLVIAPSPHMEARETSALSAIDNLTRRATQNARLLLLIKAAGHTGISDIELHRATGFPRATICARRGWDMRALIEPAEGRYVDPLTKRSYCRWRIVELLREESQVQP